MVVCFDDQLRKVVFDGRYSLVVFDLLFKVETGSIGIWIKTARAKFSSMKSWLKLVVERHPLVCRPFRNDGNNTKNISRSEYLLTGCK